MRASLSEQRVGVEIVLGPLLTAALKRIGERAERRPLGTGTVATIADAAAGNVFFAEKLAASADDGDVRVPKHVTEILDARLVRLPEAGGPIR